MRASELLSSDFPVLRPEDSLEKAVNIFHDHCICHVPVVSQDILEGLLPVDLLLGIPDHGKLISDFKSDYIFTYVHPDQHALDVFEIMARQGLSAVAVLDEQQHYLGIVSMNKLVTLLSDFYSFKKVGGIIVIKVGMRDYDLSEISRIVESNNAKILVLYLDSDDENASYDITIKMDTIDISHILATFERFQYEVKYSYPSSLQKDQIQDRYDFLMKMFDL
jgi:acetoin utilization protein AcuB